MSLEVHRLDAIKASLRTFAQWRKSDNHHSNGVELVAKAPTDIPSVVVNEATLPHNGYEMFMEPGNVVERLRSIRQQLRTESDTHPDSSALAPEQQQDEFRMYAQGLITMKGVAEGYAIWKVKKDGIRPDRIKETDEYKLTKKKALQAMLQLDGIEQLPEDLRADARNRFNTWWGETNIEYQDLYRRAKTSLKSETDGETNPSVRSILRDAEVPLKNKIELLMKGGYTWDESKRIALGLLGAGVATTIFKFSAESGAGIAEYLAHKYDVFKHLSLKEQIAANLAAYGGFYGTSYIYARRCAKLLQKSGYSLNVFASSAYHAAKFSSEKARQKATVAAVIGVDLMLDGVYLAPTILKNDLSMFAAANAFGIAFTAGQIGLTEGLIKLAERNEKRIGNSEAVEMDTNVEYKLPVQTEAESNNLQQVKL